MERLRKVSPPFVKKFQIMPQESIDLHFTTLHFYENYVISQPKEGVVIDYSEVADVIKICTEFYDNKEFVYYPKGFMISM